MTTSGHRACPSSVDLLDQYREWLVGKGMSPSTVRSRVKFAAHTREQWGETWKQTPAELATWLGQYDGWTRVTYHAHAVSLYAWLVEAGRLESSPVDGLKRGRQPRPAPSPLTLDEQQRVLEASSGDLRAFLMLGLYAGLRSHEIAKIRGEHISPTGLYVLGKGGLAASVPTHPLIWELAQSYDRRGFWFPSSWRSHEHVSSSRVGQRVRAHFRELGIPDGSVHRTRASYATNLRRLGVDLRVIQDLMRHESLASTAHYLGVTNDERMSAILRLGA